MSKRKDGAAGEDIQLRGERRPSNVFHSHRVRDRAFKESAGPKDFDADELLTGRKVEGDVLRDTYDTALVLPLQKANVQSVGSRS